MLPSIRHYADWVARISAYMSKREDCAALYAYMNKANDFCRSLTSTYSRAMLLHGDFHHDNILRRDDGSYAIIDPKGVIGDPIFDVPRFILNEFEDELSEQLYRKINLVIQTFEHLLDIPHTVIRQCLFIETAMGNCWQVEDGATPEACRQLLDNVAFADSLLHV
jgi:streptomycin 6-kinase